MALGEDGDHSGQIATDLLDDLLQGVQRAAAGHHVVYDGDFAAPNLFDIEAVEHQQLRNARGNTHDLLGHGVDHVRLNGFANYDIGFATLAANDVCQRQRLDFGRDQHVYVGRKFLGQRFACGLGDFGVAQHVKQRHADAGGHFDNRQVALYAPDFYFVRFHGSKCNPATGQMCTVRLNDPLSMKAKHEGGDNIPMLIAQLTDTHLDTRRPHKAAALASAVRHLLNLPVPPDAVIVTGDCADSGSPEEYRLFKELTALLPMPVYVVTGNHDHRTEMLRAFGTQGEQALPNFMQYTVNGPLRLIALDTHVPGENGGLLCEKRLHWLSERLKEAPDTPTLIFMHHPPLVSALQVMDSIGLRGSEELARIVSQHPQVQRIVAGHTHMTTSLNFAGTTLMTCGATDYSLLPDLSQPSKLVVQMQPAVCLLHHLTAHGDLLSYTSVIGEYPLNTLHDGEKWL